MTAWATWAQSVIGDELAVLIEDVDGYELDQLAHLLRAVRGLIRELRAVEDRLVERLAQLMPRARVEVPGVGVLERRLGMDRSHWDHDRLLPVLVARALDERKLDEATGEIEREGSAVARVLKECAGISYYRVAALRDRRINPDEYADSRPGKPGVVIK